MLSGGDVLFVKCVATVIVACGTNVITLELLQRAAPGCSIFILFAQTLFVALAELSQQIQWAPSSTRLFEIRPRAIPFKSWLPIVILAYAASALNSLSLNYDINIPLQIILRSSTLPITMVFGLVLLHKRYMPLQIMSVLMVTVGVTLFSLSSVPTRNDETAKAQTFDYRFFVGLSMQVISLVCGGLLGTVQENLHKKHGNNPSNAIEGMFYVHLLQLPFFLPQVPDFLNMITLFNLGEVFSPLKALGLHHILPISTLWVYLILSVLTQYQCVRSVYQLSAITSTLTVQLVLAVRKSLSLLVSIVYFGNAFSVTQVISTALVFGGTVLYARANTPAAPPTHGTTKQS